MSPEFLLTTLVIVASPGTGVVYTLAAGLSRGWRASVLAAFACTLGIVPHLVAALTGLAALLHTSALAFEIVKYAGVAYLLYMAWQSLRENGALRVEAGADQRSALRIVTDGILVNILNPKLSIFFVAFLPQFTSPGASAGPQLALLGLVFGLLAVASDSIWAVVAGRARLWFARQPRRLDTMSTAGGVMMIGLGATLAATD